MKKVAHKIRPKSGFSHMVYWLFVIMVPILSFLLVRRGLFEIACGVVIVSKWRMLAIRLRHWPAIIRANAVDVLSSLSFVIFMHYAHSVFWQIVWVSLFIVWLAIIKPRSSAFWVVTQATVGQFISLVSLFLVLSVAPLYALVIGTWGIAYLSARHLIGTFDEVRSPLMSHFWAFIATSITWILGHWIIYYGPIAHPAIVISIIGSSFGILYYLSAQEKLSRLARREIVFIMVITVVLLVILSYSSDITI